MHAPRFIDIAHLPSPLIIIHQSILSSHLQSPVLRVSERQLPDGEGQRTRPSPCPLFRLRPIGLALRVPEGEGEVTKWLYTNLAHPRRPRSLFDSVPAWAESHSRIGTLKPVLRRPKTAAGRGQR